MDDIQYTNTYHDIMNTSEAYSRLSANVPKVMLIVSQQIHGLFFESAVSVFRASNSYDVDYKIAELTKAQESLFSIYTGLEYLVKTRCISVGQANEVIACLKKAHHGVKKWLSSEIKGQKTKDPGVKAASDPS